MKAFTKNPKATASFLLRVGLAFAFLYAAISSFRTPAAWVGYLPSMLTSHFDAHVMLKVFSSGEILLGLWLLSGKFLRYSAAVAAVMLLGVVIANPHALDITFRDISLVFAAIALFCLASEK